MVGDLAIINDIPAIRRPHGDACFPPQIKDISTGAALKKNKIKVCGFSITFPLFKKLLIY